MKQPPFYPFVVGYKKSGNIPVRSKMMCKKMGKWMGNTCTVQQSMKGVLSCKTKSF